MPNYYRINCSAALTTHRPYFLPTWGVMGTRTVQARGKYRDKEYKDSVQEARMSWDVSGQSLPLCHHNLSKRPATLGMKLLIPSPRQCIPSPRPCICSNNPRLWPMPAPLNASIPRQVQKPVPCSGSSPLQDGSSILGQDPAASSSISVDKDSTTSTPFQTVGEMWGSTNYI